MSGGNLLATIIDSRITQRIAGPDANELGTIQPDMSLKLDRLKVPIPQGEYLVCRSLTLPEPDETIAETAEAAGHTHKMPRPEELARPADGDRVLVCWTNGGTDPVVIDVVVNSDKVVSP